VRKHLKGLKEKDGEVLVWSVALYG